MKTDFDYLIIGAGPAGLQLGYLLGQRNRDYIILDAGDRPGSFFEQFPRHDMLLTVNKVHTGYEDPERRLRYDWNSLLSDSEELLFRNFSQEFLPDRRDFLRYLAAFAEHFNLNIRYNTRVARISKPGLFELLTENGDTYRGKRLIIATGVSNPYVPDIPGIKLTENYFDCSVDANDFINQRVLILGKGNSAFETANHLIPTARQITVTGPGCVTMAWSTHYKGDLRAVNSAFIDIYHLKNQNHVLNADITRIEQRNGELVAHIAFTQAEGQTMELAYDRILVCTGFRMDGSIFDESCRPEMVPELKNRYPAFTAEWESVNVKDMYFIGVLMGAKDVGKYFSSFVSGYRYNIRVLHKLLEQKYHDVELPYQSISPNPQAIASQILERASRASAILLQPGFICDVLVVPETGEPIRYYPEINVEYVFNSPLCQRGHYYLITLEYGEFPDGDPLCVERDPDPDLAYKDVYVHPIIRRYSGSELLREHHIPEVLENDWQIFQFLRRDRDMSGSDLRQMYQDRVENFFQGELRHHKLQEPN
jgi:thioredoxin reductase